MIPEQPKNGIAKIIELQTKREEFEDKADMIQSSSPYCQLPRVFDEALDEAVKIGHEQAIIWNDIRGFITNDGKTTLWQLAIKNKYAVRMFGYEDFLKLSREELEQLQKSLTSLD